MTSVVRLALLPIIVMIVAGCQSVGATDVSTGEGAGATTPIAVEVDVMSGVPNPTWTMSNSDSSTLSGLIASLAKGGQADESADPGLGFRGFILRGLDLSALGSYDQLKVLGNEIIASKGGARGVVLLDPDRSVYTMLRAMSEQYLAANVFSQIPVDGMRGA